MIPKYAIRRALEGKPMTDIGVEIERLRSTTEISPVHVRELQADNARLRAALQEIAGDDYLPDGIRAIEIARRALEPKP
jgi:hypothetical protein